MIAIVINDIQRVAGFEWLADALLKSALPVHFILINCKDTHFSAFLQKRQIPIHYFEYRGKKDIIPLVFKLVLLFVKLKPKVVHCHYFISSLLGLTAAYIARVPKRIYTRHHSDFHWVYFPHMVKYDRLINFFATDIIAISPVVESVLIQEGVKPKKVHLIPHGYVWEEFQKVESSDIQDILKKYQLEAHYPVIGVIARYFELKGIQYIIPAFKKLLSKYPNAVLVLANAVGEYQSTLHLLLSELPNGSYREITFEPCIGALYRTMNIFVHVPISPTVEAFGLIYLESLAAGVPSIFTLSGIAPLFVKHLENAYVVEFQNSDQIYEGFTVLLSNPTLYQKLSENGKRVLLDYDFDICYQKLALLYQ